MMHRPWSSIVEVPYCFSRSNVKFQGHTALKIVKFYRNWAFLDSNSSLNSLMVMKCCTKLETAKERCPIVFQSHPSNFKVTRDKTSPLLTRIGRFRTIGRSQLSNPSDLPCLWRECNANYRVASVFYGECCWLLTRWCHLKWPTKYCEISLIGLQIFNTFLSHFGPVMTYYDIDLGQHWLRYWLVAWWHQALAKTNVDLSWLVLWNLSKTNFVKGALDFSSQNEFEKIKPVKLLHLIEAIESMIDTTTIYTILVNTLGYVPLDIIENTQI